MTPTHSDARQMPRRRILAAALAAGALSAIPPGPANAERLYRWQGRALGTRVAVTMGLTSASEAAAIVRELIWEIDRLESIFSLYRSDSEVSRLNRDGRLAAPSPELLELLSLSQRFGQLTAGAFDVTVQPLWAIHRGTAEIDPAALDKARELVDYRAIELGRNEIRLGRPGMQITLNGIAQGYITDRVAQWLAGTGLTNALLDLGEIRALGPHPGGGPWRVGLAGHLDRHASLPLAAGAVATSSRRGPALGGADHRPHIFDPASGGRAQGVETVTVRAGDATTADALSTALIVVPHHDLRRRLGPLAPLEIQVTARDGRTARWTVAG